MMAISDDGQRQPTRSPWLSMWFRPGGTIERIVSAKPAAGVLVLAALGTTGNLVANAIIDGWTAGLTDWRNLAIVVLAGLIAGVPILYIDAFFIGLAGRLLGGRAPLAHVRAALAWSMVPVIIGLFICLVSFAGVKLSQGSQSIADAVGLSLSVIMPALSMWGLVAAILMIRRVQHFGAWRALISALLGWVAATAVAGAVLAVPIRTLLFQPFYIPSGAMVPTLRVGDYILVSKYAYGYSRYSLPFSPPVFAGRIFGTEPQRGDVVVFKHPRDGQTDYIKRVIGLPGDNIQLKESRLYINGEIVPREPISNVHIQDFYGRETGVPTYLETLPGGVTHTIIQIQGDTGYNSNTQVFEVPAGNYFMMGDNRDNSTDSRIPLDQGGFGYVPFENLVGRAEMIFYSIDQAARNAKPVVRTERIGMAVR